MLSHHCSGKSYVITYGPSQNSLHCARVLATRQPCRLQHQHRKQCKDSLKWQCRIRTAHSQPAPRTAVVASYAADTLEALQASTLAREAATYAAIAVLAALTAAWQTRPRGWSDSELLEVRSSQVQGRGVFARSDIVAGTVLGAYPGRARTPTELLMKAQGAPMTLQYAYQADGGSRYLDPTDAAGNVSRQPQPGLPWSPVDTTLAFVNEPPAGGRGVNVEFVEGLTPLDVLFVALRDIARGEELFVDYGMHYDRSSYKGPS